MQPILPLIPQGATPINDKVFVHRGDCQWAYYHGMLPIYVHDEDVGAPTVFEPCLDVPFGGVLCAIPALLANGVLRGLELLGEVRGYYNRAHVLLTLAVMCLCRIPTIEKLRQYSPGEMGKLLGLDRNPEARCLRSKMDRMAAESRADTWAAELARQWMQAEPDSAGFLYVDGHVKVYGGRTKLPKRYVSRQRLCL